MGSASALVWVCDVCRHRWLQVGDRVPERCPRRLCRDRGWNLSARPPVIPLPVPQEMRERRRAQDAAFRASLAEVAAKREAEARASAPEPLPVRDLRAQFLRLTVKAPKTTA